MVSEDRVNGTAKGAEKTENLYRVRPSVYQITGKPELIPSWIKVKSIKKLS
jgi:hypothetical protein|tara:strand:- start:13473 stop:13625 length:153 start_codon:yes stop_codon:yes gene_type:complete